MTMTNRYDPSDPHHKVTCGRTKCAELERAPHPAGVHLDQRHEFYDGPDGLLSATSMYVRESARKIIREAPELTPEVVDLVTHLEWLRVQVAHVRVDKDHAVRDAMMRSKSCEHHGEEIKSLSDQLYHCDESYRRAEAGRVVLLGFLFTMDQILDGKLRADMTVTQILTVIKAASKRTHAAHDRAWKR